MFYNNEKNIQTCLNNTNTSTTQWININDYIIYRSWTNDKNYHQYPC